jgi:hypothetical protein
MTITAAIAIWWTIATATTIILLTVTPTAIIGMTITAAIAIWTRATTYTTFIITRTARATPITPTGCCYTTPTVSLNGIPTTGAITVITRTASATPVTPTGLYGGAVTAGPKIGIIHI